jgi:Family of unknown function (DUF5335)
MANDTREIPKSEWAAFFAEFTRENRGAHTTVEVAGRDIGDQVQIADEPLDGVAADNKDGESRIWITFAGRGDDHLSHSVPDPVAVRLRSTDGATILEIEARDRTKTMLQLNSQGAFRLGPVS